MIFSVTRIVATILALGGAAMALPTEAARPVCPTILPGYWECLSDCLYKTCKTGDTACINACDNMCNIEFLPGFPHCTPPPW